MVRFGGGVVAKINRMVKVGLLEKVSSKSRPEGGKGVV